MAVVTGAVLLAFTCLCFVFAFAVVLVGAVVELTGAAVWAISAEPSKPVIAKVVIKVFICVSSPLFGAEGVGRFSISSVLAPTDARKHAQVDEIVFRKGFVYEV